MFLLLTEEYLDIKIYRDINSNLKLSPLEKDYPKIGHQKRYLINLKRYMKNP